MSNESEQQPLLPAGVRGPALDPPEQPILRVSAPTVTEVTTTPEPEPWPGSQSEISPEQVREHLRRRAVFLRELAEARELRRRVTPHRSRRARIHAALRRRTFRAN